MYVYLSYPIAEGQIAWPDAPVYTSGRHDIIGINGSFCNTSVMTIPNHYGTHYDAPRHFNAKGPKITELPMDYFCFKGDEILILDIPKTFKEVITAEDVMPYKDQIAKAKLLLFRTGFEKQKELNPQDINMKTRAPIQACANILSKISPISAPSASIPCPSDQYAMTTRRKPITGFWAITRTNS